MKNGITCIIIPIMVPVSLRIEQSSIQIIFETMTFLSMVHPEFKSDKKNFPKILIVLNNYAPPDIVARNTVITDDLSEASSQQGVSF